MQASLTESCEEHTFEEHDNKDVPLGDLKAQEDIFSCPNASHMKTNINTGYHIQDHSSLSYIVIDSEKDVNPNNITMSDIGCSSVTFQPDVSLGIYDEIPMECDSELLSDSVDEIHIIDNSIGDATINITFTKDDKIICIELGN